MYQIVFPTSVRGVVAAPASKSVTQRVIAASALANGESVIENPSYCDDALAAMSIATCMGAKVFPEKRKLTIKGNPLLKEKKINCGESGLATRMFAPIVSLFDEELVLTGNATLKGRPMQMVGDALGKFGVKCKMSNGHLPIVLQGPLQGGKSVIDSSVSSQLLTGLLMALPLSNDSSELEIDNLKSRSYIDITLKVLSDYGIDVENDNYRVFKIEGQQRYSPRKYTVEGDWSGAAFMLVAGAIAGEVLVEGISLSSKQGDKAILEVLKQAGANVIVGGNSVRVSEPEYLKSFEYDATDTPDLFPPLVALAAYCEGISIIKGVGRLTAKESNRRKTLVSEFGKLGISIHIDNDYMYITGGGDIGGGNVDSHSDHRIAMALAIAALGAKEAVCIKDAHCVSKSYPTFFDDLHSILK